MTIQRIRPLQVFGTLDLDLAIAGTTMTSVGLQNTRLPTITSGQQYASAVIDPQGQFGAPETIRITVHTSGTNVATVSRAQEGTTARDHPPGSFWILCPTRDDFEKYLATATLSGNTSLTAGSGSAGGTLVPGYDPHGLITPGPPTGYYTCPVDGWYDVEWSFLANIAGGNNDTIIGVIEDLAAAAIYRNRQFGSAPCPVIRRRTYQLATATIVPAWDGTVLTHNATINADSTYTYFSCSLFEAG